MVKKQQKKGALTDYWEELDGKIKKASTLEELINYRLKVIKISAPLTYRSQNGHLIPHTYNKREQLKSK